MIKNIETRLYQTNYFWFEVFTPQQPEVIINKEKEDSETASFTSNFDYEKLPQNTWRIHFDLGLRVFPVAEISIRTSYEMICKGVTFNHLFVADVIRPMMALSLPKVIAAFEHRCTEHQVAYMGTIPVNDGIIDTFTAVVIDQYQNYRKLNDSANVYMNKTVGLRITPGSDMAIIFNSMIIIIDEFLYHNPNFKRKANRIAFSEHVEETRYRTIKMYIAEKQNQKMQFTFFNTVMICICLECSLQMLMSDKAEILMTAIEQRGLTADIQKQFLKLGTTLLKDLHNQCNNGNVVVDVLNIERDWNTILQ